MVDITKKILKSDNNDAHFSILHLLQSETEMPYCTDKNAGTKSLIEGEKSVTVLGSSRNEKDIATFGIHFLNNPNTKLVPLVYLLLFDSVTCNLELNLSRFCAIIFDNLLLGLCFCCCFFYNLIYCLYFY